MVLKTFVKSNEITSADRTHAESGIFGRKSFREDGKKDTAEPTDTD